jgi:hypothetical protein
MKLEINYFLRETKLCILEFGAHSSPCIKVTKQCHEIYHCRFTLYPSHITTIILQFIIRY